MTNNNDEYKYMDFPAAVESAICCQGDLKKRVSHKNWKRKAFLIFEKIDCIDYVLKYSRSTKSKRPINYEETISRLWDEWEDEEESDIVTRGIGNGKQ